MRQVVAGCLLANELTWVADQLRRAPWHEVLWLHRRWVLGRMHGRGASDAESADEAAFAPGGSLLASAIRHANGDQRAAAAEEILRTYPTKQEIADGWFE